MKGQMEFTTTDEAGFSFLIERNEYIEDDAPAIVKNAWKKMKQDRRAEFTKKQNLPYDDKILRQKDIAWEFFNEMQSRGYNCHVSVGGLDSITLLIWLESIGIHVPAKQLTTEYLMKC